MTRLVLAFCALAFVLAPKQLLAEAAKNPEPLGALSKQLGESTHRLQKLVEEKASPAQIKANLAEIGSLKDSLNQELAFKAHAGEKGAHGETRKLISSRARGSLYLTGNFGCALLVNNDASTFFNRSSSGHNKHNFGPYHEPLGGIGLGFLLPSPARLTLGFEWGFDFGPRRLFDELYNDGSKAQAFWTTRTQYVMPSIAFLSSSHRAKHGKLGLIGFKFGWSDLKGRVNLTSPTGLSGSYTQSASTPLFALLWRVESQKFIPRLGMGWELGYQWCKFDSIDNSQGSGIALGHGSPETNADGSKTTLDFSGWTFRLTFTGWGKSPLKKIYEEKEVRAVLESTEAVVEKEIKLPQKK